MQGVCDVVRVSRGGRGEVRALRGRKHLLGRLVLAGWEGRREVGRLEVGCHRVAPARAGKAVRNALLEGKGTLIYSVKRYFHLI